MKKLVTSMLIIACAASSAFATSQLPDKIIYQGKTYDLHTNPMEPYFAKHPDKKPKGGRYTGLWRGYVATFEVKEGRLLLKDIKVRLSKRNRDGVPETSWVSVIDKVVPNGEVLPIDWFTGILVMPHGKLVRYIHMSYASIYGNYTLLEARKGKITGKRSLDDRQYEKFRDKQFRAYKKTAAHRREVASVKRNGRSDQFIDDFLRIYVTDYNYRFPDDSTSPRKSANEAKN